jgi:CDP-2,3-bis-(O-geranylgeranyl)-sn-glycerol synthase
MQPLHTLVDDVDYVDDLALGIRLLILLAAANTAPLVAKRLMGTRWNRPLDGGRLFVDGRPLLGPSKTIRGVLAALLACLLLAPVVGLPAAAGALLAVGAMTGDAVSSFTKRRLGLQPSGQAYGLDQVPESLVPLLLVQAVLPVPLAVVIGATVVFLLLEPPLARMTHRLGWRDQPY